MTKFQADVPLNLNATITGHGRVVVHGPVRGEFLPAGEVFEVDDNLSEAFLAEFGPRPATLGVSGPGAAQGRIPGLRRV